MHMRIGIAAPTPALRAGLHAMLQSTELEVVDESASLVELAALFSNLDGIIVADELLLNDLDEIDLDLDSPVPALVVMSEHAQAAAMLHALPLRGWGVVPPDVAPDALQAAMVAAAQGMVVVGRALADRVLERPPAMTIMDTGSQEEALTARELEVLELLSQGLSNKQIAYTLQISEHTVKFHVSSLYAKLGASSRTDAISRGARKGLVSF